MADSRVLRPLPLLLLLLSAAQACMDTVLQKGTMPDGELVIPELNVTTSCACCGLCHHFDNCASLSFSSGSGACRLYSSVPDFTRLTVDSESELFVRPGRSGHQQFCRHDSDCVEDGDHCSGRICTNDTTVTCRDLAETFGAPMNDVYYGSLDLTLMKFYCASHSDIDGWTLVSRMTQGKKRWNRENLMKRNSWYPGNVTYSILAYADQLRQAGVEATFQILVMYKKTGSELGFLGSLAVEQSLVVSEFTGPGSGVHLQDVEVFGGYPPDNAILPWMPPSGKALLSLKEPQDKKDHYVFTLLNTQNRPFAMTWADPYTTAEYYVRE